MLLQVKTCLQRCGHNVTMVTHVHYQMYADAHIKRAAIYGSLCDLQKCYEEFDKAIEKKKDHGDIYLQRGRVGLLCSLQVLSLDYRFVWRVKILR